MKKTASIVGVSLGTVVATLWAMPALPQSPAEAITWTDALVHFVETTGQAGVIIVLMATIGGLVYYYEGKRLPAEAAEKRELRAELKQFQVDRFNFQEKMRDRLERLVKNGTITNVQLNATLVDILNILDPNREHNSADIELELDPDEPGPDKPEKGTTS